MEMIKISMQVSPKTQGLTEHVPYESYRYELYRANKLMAMLRDFNNHLLDYENDILYARWSDFKKFLKLL